MATTGRPPKPVENKRRLGNPGQRPLPDKASVVHLVAADDAPPTHLHGVGLDVWNEIFSIAPWVAASDRRMLLELCELFQVRDEMLKSVSSSALVFETPNGAMQANPLLSHIRDFTKQLHSLASLFGLTPADRTRIGLGEVAAKSKLQAMMEKQKVKNADL